MQTLCQQSASPSAKSRDEIPNTSESNRNAYRQFLCLLSDFCQRLLPHILSNLPSAEDVSLLENLFDFLQCSAHGLRKHEEDMDARSEVECSKDEICLPGDVR